MNPWEPGIIYIGSPYMHVKSHVRRARVTACGIVAAELLMANKRVYAPLVHGYYTKVLSRVDIPESVILANCFSMLKLSSQLMVLCLPGWEESDGLRQEREVAKTLGIPEVLIDEGILCEKLPLALVKRLRKVYGEKD